MTDKEKVSIRDLLKTADINLSERQTNILCRAFELSLTKIYEQGLAEGRKEDCGEAYHFRLAKINFDLEKENSELRKRIEDFNSCGNTVDKQTYYEAVNDLTVLKKEYMQTEKEYAELKVLAKNRKAFIDWCAEHHEEVLKEYTGFIE